MSAKKFILECKWWILAKFGLLLFSKGNILPQKRVKSGKKVPMGKNSLKLSTATILSQKSDIKCLYKKFR